LAAALALYPALPQAGTLPGEAKAQTCFACHGPNGQSGTPEVPSLAGQQKDFIVAQLYQFREGRRKDAQMAPLTVNLSDRDTDLAQYFAQVPPEPQEQLADAAAVTTAARPLIDRQHCATCHGESFEGRGQMPRLAGQQKVYLVWQLRAYRDGKRVGIDGSMLDATKPLTNEQISLLATYITQITVP
jgi:cytochrome c553